MVFSRLPPNPTGRMSGRISFRAARIVEGRKMHRLVKSVRVKAVFPEALRFADEVSEYFNSKYCPENLRVYVSSFGDVSSVFWDIECGDSALREALNSGFLADEQYLSMLRQIEKAGTYVPGSTQDSVAGVRSLKETLSEGRGPVSALATANGKMTTYWIPGQYHFVAIGEYSTVKGAAAGAAALARAG